MIKLKKDLSREFQYKRLLKFLLRFTAAFSMMTLLSGCVGMIIDSIGKPMATKDTYGEMLSTLTPIKNGSGRLYIYRTENSTKTYLIIGVGLSKNTVLCTVDNTVYDLIWEAFKYIDLPEGTHEVTCGIDVTKERNIFTGQRYFQRGVNKIQISISNGNETFVRVDVVEENPFFQPIPVENSQGHKEIFELPYQTGGWLIPGGKEQINP